MISYGTCLSLSDLLHCMIISSCIHVAANGIISFFFMASGIPLYIYTTSSSSIHLSVNGHLGCFYVLAIVNSAGQGRIS